MLDTAGQHPGNVMGALCRIVAAAVCFRKGADFPQSSLKPEVFRMLSMHCIAPCIPDSPEDPASAGPWQWPWQSSLARSANPRSTFGGQLGRFGDLRARTFQARIPELGMALGPHAQELPALTTRNGKAQLAQLTHKTTRHTDEEERNAWKT